MYFSVWWNVKSPQICFIYSKIVAAFLLNLENTLWVWFLCQLDTLLLLWQLLHWDTAHMQMHGEVNQLYILKEAWQKRQNLNVIKNLRKCSYAVICINVSAWVEFPCTNCWRQHVKNPERLVKQISFFKSSFKIWICHICSYEFTRPCWLCDPPC